MKRAGFAWFWGAIGGLFLWLATMQVASALTSTQNRQIDRFALGNAIWILYHEIGHLLINEFQLPVLGREEDAADHFATITLLEGADQQMDGFLTDAVDGFSLSAQFKRKTTSERLYFAGHGLDEQRAFEVVCLMLGNDEAAFTSLADSINLPANERDRCPSAYQLARTSWLSVLEPQTGGWLSRPSTDTVLFSYGEASAAHTAVKILLQQAEVLEAASEFLSGKYVFPRQVMLRAEECGDANAYFRPEDGAVVICYELVEEFRWLLTAHFHDR